MYSVFISYSHVDSAIADSICSLLEKANVSYFRDVKDINWGDGINDEVRAALLNSESILVIISPASLKSPWVPFEVGYCSALGRRVLPYLTHPSLDRPGYISDLKYLSSLDAIPEYFDRAAKKPHPIIDSEPKRKPDIRITYSPAKSRGIGGKTKTIVVFSVANHDESPIYINNVSLLTKDNMRLQITNDAVTGLPYNRKVLNSGERMDFTVSREAFGPSEPFAPNGIDPHSIEGVVATDDIGPQFFGDQTNLIPVILELFPEKKPYKNSG